MKICDDTVSDPYVVATFVPPTTPCNGEEYNRRFSLDSVAGNAPPQQFNPHYIAKTSSRTATSDGVEGTRETFKYLTDSGLPPPKGAILVRYVFLTGGRTYTAVYDHYANEPDRTSTFDQLVVQTLRFT